jgi:hypothetical protein
MRRDRTPTEFFVRGAIVSLAYGVAMLGFALTNLLTGFFGGWWFTGLGFIIALGALRQARFLWRKREQAPPEPRVWNRVKRWFVMAAALVTVAVTVIAYFEHGRDLVSALLLGILVAFSLGSGILISAKMYERTR